VLGKKQTWQMSHVCLKATSTAVKVLSMDCQQAVLCMQIHNIKHL
jgi:hypothetical protein